MIIKKAEYIKSGTKMEHFPEEGMPEIMLCGRSNVGKSSFINMALQRKNIAHTSCKPGKTQTLNFYLVNEQFYFVDVPGYGYAHVDQKTRESFGIMIDNYLLNRQSLKAVILLVDFRHEPTKDDVLMYNYLKHFNKKVIVVCTKLDKIKKSQYFKNLKIVKTTLNLDKEDEIVVTSSETREGREEFFEILKKYI
jgi:GTP-binding protein